jgi:hypothetical protein
MKLKYLFKIISKNCNKLECIVTDTCLLSKLRYAILNLNEKYKGFYI